MSHKEGEGVEVFHDSRAYNLKVGGKEGGWVNYCLYLCDVIFEWSLGLIDMTCHMLPG